MNTSALSNPNASERTKNLFRLLQENSGKKIILGQQESPRTIYAEREVEWIQAVSGELPAIRGLDFIHDDYDGAMERARRWNDRGGIVTICWHTGIEGNDYPSSKEENPDWEELLGSDSEIHDRMRRRWDRTAEALLRLQQDDIPVLWRPFHEFDGQWFWWGKGGGDYFRKIWKIMYHYFTDIRGLNNLIWVLGYADDVRDGWDPGERYFDIAGSDTYRGETVHAEAYRRLKTIYPDKMLAFHECGLIPEIDAFFEENCVWSWLMPWHTSWLMNNHPARIAKAYHDERTITLGRLDQF